MDKEKALAICFANLKGYKDKDLVGTAEALRYLKNLPEYRTNKKVGQAVGVSGEIVREFLAVFKLPEPIQSLFRQRQLRRLEQVRRLWQLARKEPNLLEDATQAISTLSALDGRHLIDLVLRYPKIPVEEARRAVLESKTVREHEFHIIAILKEAEYKQLTAESRRRKIAIDVLVTNIVTGWLQSHGYDS